MQEMQKPQVRSLGQKDPLEEEMAPTAVFLPGKSHGQRSLAGYSPGVAKSQTQLTQHTHPDQNLAVMICSAQVEGHGARELTEV